MTDSTSAPARRDYDLLITGLVGGLIVGSALVILVVRQARFAFVDPTAWVGVETASALARLFGALILLLFPDDRANPRFRWLAAGMVVLGLSGLGFGFVTRLFYESPSLNQSMYASIVVRTLAGGLFAIGLIPERPPRFSSTMLAITATVFLTCSMLVAGAAERLPQLITFDDLTAAAEQGDTPLRGLTTWHWALSTLPLVVIAAAGFGAIRHRATIPFGRWLMLAMVLLAGSQLHNMLWPAVFSPILTTGNVLRLAFSAVIVIGGTLALRRVATERAAYVNHLAEMAQLKADFTSMVAHELASPVAAIRGYTDLLALDNLDQATRIRAVDAVRQEADLLSTLVGDVRTSTDIERDDFGVMMRPAALAAIFNSAVMYANTLPGAHPVDLDTQTGDISVWVDRERIGQVLRNLLNNAARYSPPGTPITIRAVHDGMVIRIDVEDQGSGVDERDHARIFEKFERGRERPVEHVSGLGLGLYLSREIIKAHGSEIRLTSRPGGGSVFSFTLNIAE